MFAKISIFLISIFVVSAVTIESDVFEHNITVGFVGDMVPSVDSTYNETVFDNVIHDTKKPDLMIGNLEGTFAKEGRTSKCVYINSKCHAFSGNANFADALKSAGFDFVSLVNNHSYDFGEDGLEDTKKELNRVGIKYISSDKPTEVVEVRGKRIAVLGLSSTKPWESISDYNFIESEVTKLRNENDYVVVIFHGGAEGSDKSIVPGVEEFVGDENRGNVEKVAKTAVDAGANIVLGSGPHVLRKIEMYSGSPIAYSLGNFVGANKLISIGTLSYSGIFTASLSDTKETKYDFKSILLSPTGVPSLDPLNQSLKFLENLK